MLLPIVIAFTLSYFLGAIPFSYLIAKKVRNIDVRTAGEGNVGARNVWHTVGKKHGIFAALLDAGKGLAAFGTGKILGLDFPWIWFCGLGVVLGHSFPVFLKGRGGKGVACAFGFLLGMQPIVILMASVLLLLVYLTFKNFHVALAISMASIPVFWKVFMKRSWKELGFLAAFLILLGLKRLIDEPYMKKIKQTSEW